jgi:hypothetical protein
MASSTSACRWIDRLTALEHLDEAGDFLHASPGGFHVPGAKGKRVEVLLAQRAKGLESPGLGFDRLHEVVRHLHLTRRGVGCFPTPVGLSGLDMLEAVRSHAAGCNQPFDVLAIVLRPHALGSSRREALQK